MMKKVSSLLVSIMLSSGVLYAQDTKPYVGNAISIQAGTYGFGLGVAHQLKSGLNVRLTADYLNVKTFVKPPIKVNLGDGASDLNINPDVTSLLFSAKFDWHPFRQKIFKLVAGASYGSGDFLVDVEPTQKTGRFKLTKDVELDAEEFGTAKLIVTGNNIRPYLGLGFGRAIPKKRLGFGVDLGVYYSGSPKLAVARTGLIESILTDQNIADIERNVKGYAFMPNLTFSLTYKIGQ
ncbi:hypothetical protein [Flectobacillus major]|uniref:hypothetical protein n=1 Tax=Flectobacillus major TaxID=103 RepID=UPI0004040510|nr:hypothetical protein [Flectobacillus major]